MTRLRTTKTIRSRSWRAALGEVALLSLALSGLHNMTSYLFIFNLYNILIESYVYIYIYYIIFIFHQCASYCILAWFCSITVMGKWNSASRCIMLHACTTTSASGGTQHLQADILRATTSTESQFVPIFWTVRLPKHNVRFDCSTSRRKCIVFCASKSYHHLIEGQVSQKQKSRAFEPVSSYKIRTYSNTTPSQSKKCEKSMRTWKCFKTSAKKIVIVVVWLCGRFKVDSSTILIICTRFYKYIYIIDIYIYNYIYVRGGVNCCPSLGVDRSSSGPRPRMTLRTKDSWRFSGGYTIRWLDARCSCCLRIVWNRHMIRFGILSLLPSSCPFGQNKTVLKESTWSQPPFTL